MNVFAYFKFIFRKPKCQLSQMLHSNICKGDAACSTVHPKIMRTLAHTRVGVEHSSKILLLKTKKDLTGAEQPSPSLPASQNLLCFFIRTMRSTNWGNIIPVREFSSKQLPGLHVRIVQFCGCFVFYDGLEMQSSPPVTSLAP